MSIGENLRALRKRSGMKQQELAEKVHVSAALISSVENGRRSLNLEIARDIAKVLDCTVDALVE